MQRNVTADWDGLVRRYRQPVAELPRSFIYAFKAALNKEFLGPPRNSLPTAAHSESAGRFVGRLRRALAYTVLTARPPDLVILDEFERYRDLLSKESRGDALVAALFEPKKSPPSLLLLSAVPPDSQQEFADSVEDLIKTAQYLVKLNWRSVLSGEEFSSTLVLDDDGVVWESVIGSLVVEEVEILPAGKEKSGMVTIKWFWGSERGTIEWGVECDGPPLACSYSSKAQMASGEARIETHFVKSEECCTLYYGWAYRTPTGSISIEWNPETERFDIEVSSWGSTGSGQGIMECCVQ